MWPTWRKTRWPTWWPELVVVLTMVQVEVAAEVMGVIEVVADTQVH